MPEVDAHPEAHLTGRQRRRLGLARENGFLNATCRNPEKLVAAYARWCWLLRIPVVWSERCSPRSRYGRVRLDLFTTPHRLTADCQADLQSLAPHAATSPHDVHWKRIPLRDLDRVSAAAIRAATRPSNHQSNSAYTGELLPPAKILRFDQPVAATG